jgi:hypothetical protein
MQINKSGRNDLASSIDRSIAGCTGTTANFGYLPVLDPEITLESWNPGSIDDRAPTYMDIETFH